jgi:hypothetical protein
MRAQQFPDVLRHVLADAGFCNSRRAFAGHVELIAAALILYERRFAYFHDPRGLPHIYQGR